MKSFEQEVKELLDQFKVPYMDYGASYDAPDLHVELTTGSIYLELKEKRQAYNPSHWPLLSDEHNAFIIDEFTVRKMVTKAPWVGLVVRDNTTGLYYFADIYTLLFTPHNRCNRNMESVRGDEIVNVKGKWCLDFRYFPGFDNLKDLFRAIKWYMSNSPIDPAKGVDCWNLYETIKEIPTCGTLRPLSDRSDDVNFTR